MMETNTLGKIVRETEKASRIGYNTLVSASPPSLGHTEQAHFYFF